jgi:DNA-binding MarR family transcriptional regulator
MATRSVKGNGRKKSARSMRTAAQEPRLPLWARPGYLVRRLHQVNYALWLEELGHANVTPVQYSILTALSIRGVQDQTTLADEVGIDRTNVAEVLSRLEARKLVRRKENPSDRRARLATITPKGRALMTGLFPAMQRSQDRLLAPLTQKERDVFMHTLARLIEANDEFGRATTRAD